MMHTAQIAVFSAGGLILRPGATEPEIFLIHRPHRQDWSLPKGKREPGESMREAALREVAEETGMDCEIRSDFLAVQHYPDRNEGVKQVQYWIMAAAAGAGFVPNEEADDGRWVPLSEAKQLLTRDFDHPVIDQLQAYLAAHGAS